MITDPTTIIPCTSCKTPIAVQNALMVERHPGKPEDGVYLYCSEACQERHYIARQVTPMLRKLLPIEDERNDGLCHACQMPRDECECEPEY
jgi:hypothetical protein